MKTPRRGFLKGLAVVPLAPVTLAAAPTPAPAAPPPSLADTLTDAARLAVGGQFQGADAADVTKAIASGQKAATALRAARQRTSADEPVTAFAARPLAAGAKGGRP